MFFTFLSKNLIKASIISISILFASCSKSEPDISVSIDEPARKKITVLEDTVYINKSGGNTFMHLLYPNRDSVVVINNNSWLECSIFQANNDAFPSQYSEIKALNNPDSRERIGSICIKYKVDSGTSSNKLMDTVVVVQLATNDVIDTEYKKYIFDEYGCNFNIYTSFSDLEATINNPVKGWIQDMTRESDINTKFSFTIPDLPSSEDSLCGQIVFSNPTLTPDRNKYASPLIRTANILQRRSIIIENKIAMLKKGSSHILQLNLFDKIKKDGISFSNLNKDVANISESGCITGLSEGNDTIIVSTRDNKYQVMMPITIGKENIYGPDNRVKLGLGVSYSNTGMSFFASIENNREKDIHIDSLFIYNNMELVSTETAEDKLGDIAPNEKKIVNFYFSAQQYQISCKIKYKLDDKKYVLNSKDNIIVN